MRLIDAGALKKKAQMRGHVLKKSMVTVYHMCVSTHDIDEAPTVDAEPVRHGRWKTMPYRTVEHGNVVISGEAEMCTNCRCAKKEYHKQMNYCPNCGAKMDEEVQ